MRDGGVMRAGWGSHACGMGESCVRDGESCVQDGGIMWSFLDL